MNYRWYPFPYLESVWDGLNPPKVVWQVLVSSGRGGSMILRQLENFLTITELVCFVPLLTVYTLPSPPCQPDIRY